MKANDHESLRQQKRAALDSLRLDWLDKNLADFRNSKFWALARFNGIRSGIDNAMMEQKEKGSFQ